MRFSYDAVTVLRQKIEEVDVTESDSGVENFSASYGVRTQEGCTDEWRLIYIDVHV